MKFHSILYVLQLLLPVVFVSGKQKCKNWCKKNEKDWKVKCEWKDCRGCGKCESAKQKCKNWCKKNEQDWKVKCNWEDCVGCDKCEQPPPKKPNILLILADDVGTGDIPFYWEGMDTSLVDMPNLQKLADQGVLFEDAHSTPLCAPSRYMLLSGNYPHRGREHYATWEWNNDQNHFLDGQKSIAHDLGNAGYKTAMFGKWHLGAKIPPNGMKCENRTKPFTCPKHDWSMPLQQGPGDIGFHESVVSMGGLQSYPYNFFRNDMIDFDVQRTKYWEEGTYSMPFGNSTIRKGKGGEGDPDWDVAAYDMILVNETKDFIENHLEGGDDKPFFAYVAFGGVHTPHNPPNEYIDKSKVANVYLTKHLDMLGLVDKAVGSLMKIIEDKGLQEDTIILFSSDNGGLGTNHGTDLPGHNGSGPLRGSKGQVYDGGHRVPLIISQPGTFGQGERRDQVVGLNDMYATITELVGVEPSDNSALDSISFADYIKDANKRSKRETLGQGTFKLKKNKNWAHALRKDQYKFVHHPHNNTFEFYNMKWDIGETNNMLEGDPADWIVTKAVKFCKTLRRIGPCPIDGTRFESVCKKKCMSFDKEHYCDFSYNGILTPGITYNETSKDCKQ